MKQKGGIRILPEYESINKVLSYIITGSTFEIFTENTIAGITILSTLKPEFQQGSPCRVTRARGFDKPIIKFLFKFSLWGEKDGFNRKSDSSITNITSTDSLLREFTIQQDIFMKSSIDPTTLFEPLCPALVTGVCNVKEHIKRDIRNKILRNLKQRTNDGIDSTKIQTLFDNKISFIVMEFMEGYRLLTHLERDEHFRKYKLFSLYELTKLHSYGYKHGDFHNSNVLISANYPYFTNEENKDLDGRAILIDFGLAESIQITTRNRIRNIIQYDFTEILDATIENDFVRFDSYRNKTAKNFINSIIEKGWDIHGLPQYDLLKFERRVLTGGLNANYSKNRPPLKTKEKSMARQPRELKPWWSSPEEEQLAIAELRAALDRQENDKDYDKKIHESVQKLVDELASNENFQKMITGIKTPPVFIGENSDSQDELGRLLEEYNEKEKTEKEKEAAKQSGNGTPKKKPLQKRRKSTKNKSSKSR